MYSDLGWQILALVVIIWIGLLTVLILQQSRFLKLLFPKEGTRGIRKKFEEVIGATAEFEKKILEVKKRLDFLEEDGLRHVQRVKLIRYNPYEDTGGDQSFSVCFLDQEGSGFVITSLHTRSGTRVFAKPVSHGKSTKYEFSKEEQEVVNLAIKA